MKNDDIEELVPGDEDENIGGEPPKKKKEKKRKSKEERLADRKLVFWVMVIVIVVTGLFYLYPLIRGGKLGSIFSIEKKDNTTEEKKDGGLWKGYTEMSF